MPGGCRRQTGQPPVAERERAYVWLDPGRQFGQACVGGTRLQTECVVNRWWYTDETMAEICADYQITPGQVLTAIWYEATYGRRTWGKRQGEWKRHVDDGRWLWHGQYGECTEPPRGAKG